MDILDRIIAKKLYGGSGGGEAANIQPLTVTENGTYDVSGDVDGYAPIVVDVAGSGGGEQEDLETELTAQDDLINQILEVLK